MPRILEPAVLRAAAVLLALVLALPGCGPGTGGTGTGPISLTFSGSGGASLAAPPAFPASPCPDAACDRIDLRLEEDRVALQAACSRFVHAGDWAVDDAGLAVLEGSLETTTAAGTSSVPATLRLQFTERDLARANVSVLLLDARGAALLGPVNLQGQGAAPPPAPACTPR
jgi:hypothetical protein